MKQLYYILNESIKSYHVLRKANPKRALELLKRINEARLQIAILAEQRQIFIDQINVPASAAGYKQDIFFTHDDLDSLVIKAIASLEDDVTVSLIQEGTREIMFTRQQVAWQHLFSDVQDAAVVGQQIPFNFIQEIPLGKSQSLNIGVTGQTVAGFIFVHGCNLKDDTSPTGKDFITEINTLDEHGQPRLPQPQLVPLQFKFPTNAVNEKAVGVDGGAGIFSIKSERSVILTEVSTTASDSRISLLDRGRDQEICTEVESRGVAGNFTDQYAVYYPLPYPHLLRAHDRLQMRGLNGSLITGNETAANATQTTCFRGFTI